MLKGVVAPTYMKIDGVYPMLNKKHVSLVIGKERYQDRHIVGNGARFGIEVTLPAGEKKK